MAEKYWLPVEPLLPYLVDANGDRLTDEQLRQMTGMQSADYYRRQERISDWHADIFACRVVKVHPMLIWGDAWFEGQVAPAPRAVA